MKILVVHTPHVWYFFYKFMVDRIEKTALHPQYRVNASEDALDRQKKDQSGQQEEGTDEFDLFSEKTDWHILFDQPHLWQQNIEVMTDEIDVLQFLGVNLKTDPSLLKVKVSLADGNIIPNAFLSVPRSFGLQVKNYRRLEQIPVETLTRNHSVWLTVPKDEQVLREEITRVTQIIKEKTFSQTFKMMLSQRNLLQKLGIQDPVSKRMNNEILGIYIVISILLISFLFGLLYLM